MSPPPPGPVPEATSGVRTCHPAAMHSRWPGAVALAAALLVGGCGSDDVRQATDDGAAGEVPRGACALISPEEVSELFGREAAVTPVEGAPTESTSCHWSAEEDLGTGVLTRWQLQLEAHEGSSLFDPAAWGDDPRSIDGLGDEAFVVDGGGFGGVTAGYRDGEKVVFLTYAIVLGDAPDPADQADELVALLRRVHDRF